MKPFLIAYISALAPMLVLDGVWLALVSKRFYSPRIGHLMTDSPQLAPIALFYLLYAFGVVMLAALPAARSESLAKAFWMGALVGLVAYGTYDLTNQATLKDWSVAVTIVDMTWGTLLTGVTSTVAAYATRRFV